MCFTANNVQCTVGDNWPNVLNDTLAVHFTLNQVHHYSLLLFNNRYKTF